MKILAMLFCAVLTGCAGPPSLPSPSLFHDAAFAAPSGPVDAADLFTLSADMQAYLHSPRLTALLRTKGQDRGLVEALYEKGQLQLDYDSSKTRTAAETFAARSGNCLSLVIMTAAFARELGMTVRYQSVDVERSWSRNNDLFLVSSHVNLSIGHRVAQLAHGADVSPLLTVDFLPARDVNGYRTLPLEQDDIVAMYMNNRAVESLVHARLDDAYWWARAALRRRPDAAIAYNTLGVVYQRHGDLALAEQAFGTALAREPRNLAVMENLVPVLDALGKRTQAQSLRQRIAAIDPAPPFHYFNQGIAALQRGALGAAKDLFAREVRRSPDDDEFHFWLAVACLQLGEEEEAQQQLALALDRSTRRDTRELYSAKLMHLRALSSQRAQTR
jgi:Tfp pilus assembly protein PilF